MDESFIEIPAPMVRKFLLEGGFLEKNKGFFLKSLPPLSSFAIINGAFHFFQKSVQ